MGEDWSAPMASGSENEENSEGRSSVDYEDSVPGVIRQCAEAPSEYDLIKSDLKKRITLQKQSFEKRAKNIEEVRMRLQK